MKKIFPHLAILFLLTCIPTSFAQNVVPPTPVEKAAPEEVLKVDAAKNKLQQFADRLNKQLVQLEAKIEKLPRIDHQNYNDLLKSFEDDATKILSIQQAIISAIDLKTLRDEAQQLRQTMNDIRAEVKKFFSLRFQQHIQNFRRQKDQFFQKVQDRLGHLKARGIDVSVFEKNLQDYATTLTKATSILDQAMAQFQQLQTLPAGQEVTPVFSKAVELFHQGRMQLPEKHSIREFLVGAKK